MAEKILIVDDDVDTLRLVGLMLQRQGYQIVAANNGTQAIAMAQAENPDLVILDVMMPDMDGYEVTRRLRAAPSTSNVPIIMFTAKSQVDDKVTGFEVGVDDYLTKPTQPRELFAHVKALLSRAGKSARSPAASTPARERGVIIGVMSAKGGLGNSTLAVNLGVVLHHRTRKDVVVAELRPGEGSMSLDLGYTKPDGLSRLLQRRPNEITPADIEKEMVTLPSGVHMLPASYQPSDACMKMQADSMEAIARNLGYIGSFVILDLGPAIPPTTEKILPLCDGLIIILEPIPFTIQRTRALLDDLKEKGFGEGRISLVLINRIRTEMQLSWTQVQEQLGIPIGVAFTPAPELVYQAARKGVPVVVQHPDGLITQQFTKLADAIANTVRQKT